MITDTQNIGKVRWGQIIQGLVCQLKTLHAYIKNCIPLYAMAGCCTFLSFRKTNLTARDRIKWREETQEEEVSLEGIIIFL